MCMPAPLQSITVLPIPSPLIVTFETASIAPQDHDAPRYVPFSSITMSPGRSCNVCVCMCACMYVYISCVKVYTHTNKFIHKYIHISTDAFIHAYICTHVCLMLQVEVPATRARLPARSRLRVSDLRILQSCCCCTCQDHTRKSTRRPACDCRRCTGSLPPPCTRHCSRRSRSLSRCACVACVRC
jgi:hypothetical protein